MNQTVKMIDLHASYVDHQQAIDQAVQRVIHSGWYLVGKELEAFEQDFAQWCHIDHAIGTANGTDAIELALRAIGVGKGDAVLTVSQTAVATAAAIVRCGAEPVFVDVDPERYTMCPSNLRSVIGSWSQHGGLPLKAIVPVHLYGQPADMAAIMSIAQEHGLAVIEDCAQAHGATLNGKPVGSFGDLAAFSFYPTKNLGAMGDAGAVITQNGEWAASVRSLREYGWEKQKRYISSMEGGINSRMDELQAAVLCVKLKGLHEDNHRRQKIAAMYNSQLGTLGQITLPEAGAGVSHVYHLYVVQVDERNDIREKLMQKQIATGIHYPLPVHQQPAYRRYIQTWNPLPVTEAMANRIMSLPMYPQLPERDVQRVVDELKTLVG